MTFLKLKKEKKSLVLLGKPEYCATAALQLSHNPNSCGWAKQMLHQGHDIKQYIELPQLILSHPKEWMPKLRCPVMDIQLNLKVFCVPKFCFPLSINLLECHFKNIRVNNS